MRPERVARSLRHLTGGYHRSPRDAYRGVFRDDLALREEFLRLVLP